MTLMRRCAWLLLGLLCSCRDTSTTPTSTNLAGSWLNRGDGGFFTVLAFESGAEAPYEFPLSENEVDAGGLPASVVYLGDELTANPYAAQLATWKVENDAVTQTVLADMNADPGQQYSTKIFSFKAGESMELESKNVADGRRTYTFHPRCPVTGPVGWARFGGQQCITPVSSGTSMAIDSRGEVHVINSVGGGTPALCPPTPTISDFTRGCIPRWSTAPPYRASSSTIGDDDVWRVAMVNMDDSISLRERPARGGEWTVKEIAPPPTAAIATEAVRLFETPAGRVVLHATTSGLITLYRGDSFTKELPVFPSGTNQSGSFFDAVVDAEGRLAVLTSSELLRETSSGWTTTAPPRGAAQSGSLRFVGNQLHAAWTGRPFAGPSGNVAGGFGVYAIHDGQAWTLRQDLGLVATPLVTTEPGGPLEFIAEDFKGSQNLARFTFSLDGGYAAELLTDDPALGSSSLPPWVHPLAVRGPGGLLAATTDGQMIFLKQPGLMPARDAVVHVHFNGPGAGRVRSLDGRVDCSADCDVTMPRGTRLAVTMTPEPGSALNAPCFDEFVQQSGFCWLDAVAAENTFNFTRSRTAVRSTTKIGGSNGMAGADRFSVFGSKLAVAANFVRGTTAYSLGRDDFDTRDPGATVGLAVADRQAHLGWARSLPTEPLAISPADDQGAWAVLAPTTSLTLDGVTGGTASKLNVLVARFGADGHVTAFTSLAVAPSSGVFVVGSRVGHDGTAVVAVSSGSPLAALGLTENNGVLWRDASGMTRAVGVAGAAWGSASVALDGARALVVADGAGTTRVVTLQDGAVTGGRDVLGVRTLGTALQGARLLAVFDVNSAVSFGGAQRAAGTRVVVEYDGAGAWVADSPVTNVTPFYGVRATDVGAIVAAGTTVQGYGAGLAPGTPTALPSPLGQVVPGSGGPGDVGVGVLFVGFTLVDFAPAP